MAMEKIVSYIVTAVLSLITGYLSQFIQPKSRLVYWSPHNFLFNLQNEEITLLTNSIIVQNTGRLPAEHVEIIHKQRPDFFELFPSMEFQEGVNPNGEHVIKLNSLGPKEWVLVQMLSYRTPTIFSNIRWLHGQGKMVQIQPQRVLPKWVNLITRALIIIGMGTVFYYLVLVSYYLVSHSGLV
ncbi:MAG: hypothetical protein HY910_18620 [Desulfarculus sp.]|nr:hypothetical protein [Desulfarculus sp.]